MLVSTLFTDKYFPKSFDEFIGNVEVVDRVRSWAKAWSEGKPQKPIFFYGGTGVGKTTLAQLVAMEFKWQFFEMNASDLRDREAIEKIAGAATANSSLFGSKRLILLDEVDGLQSRDGGGSSAIVRILKEANNPVILIANDIYSERYLSEIRPVCELIEFKKINYLSIAKRLREICLIENIAFDDDAIKEIARNCAGDFRSALLDVQSLSPKIALSGVNALSHRERKEKIFPVISKVFKGKSIKEVRDAVDYSDVSFDTIFLWVEENIPRQFDSIDAATAFDSLSRADVFNGRIMNRQHWGFLKYSILLSTSGVALSRRRDYHSFVPLAFPSILSSLSSSSKKRSTRKEIASKMGEKMHCSVNEVLKNFPFYTMLVESEKYSKSLVYFFGFDEDEVAFLLGKKSGSAFVENLMKEVKKIGQECMAKKIHSNQHTLFD